MRIGVDGYNLALPDGTGVATYGRALVDTLRSMGHEVEGVFGIDAGGDPDLREVLFYDRLGAGGEAASGGRRWRRLLPPGRRAGAAEVSTTGLVDARAFAERLPRFDRIWTSPGLWRRAHLLFRRERRFLSLRIPDPPDAMHWTYPLPVRLEGARNLYTLHDLVPLRLPHTTLDDKGEYRALVRACVANADQVVTVSEASRRDIITHLGAAPGRVTNTHQISTIGSDGPAGDREEDTRIVRGAFGLEPGGYFLFFGALEPKKNVGRLVEAFLSIRTAAPLVLVVGREWRSGPDAALMARAEASGRVRRVEHLPRRLLAGLVRGARAVAFPSLYEGFGLPVHEAMLLGAPVLSSCEGAIPEVAGDAALLVDPYDVAAIAAGLERLDADSGLRAELAARGRAQAALFSIERYSERLTEAYRLAGAAA